MARIQNLRTHRAAGTPANNTGGEKSPPFFKMYRLCRLSCRLSGKKVRNFKKINAQNANEKPNLFLMIHFEWIE